MRNSDAIFAALGAIRINMLRSALTALAIIIGVGAVIVMISVGARGSHPTITEDDAIAILAALLFGYGCAVDAAEALNPVDIKE